MSKATASLVRIIDHDRSDADERVTALRLQAEAWRLLAVIACHAPDYAKNRIGWLLMNTVPFTNGEAVREFINEHQKMAEDYGKKAGIFK